MAALRKPKAKHKSLNKVGAYLDDSEYKNAYQKAKASGIKTAKGDVNMSAFVREAIKQYKV